MKRVYKLKRICIICNREFIINSSMRKCCSLKCSKINHINLTNNWRKNHIERVKELHRILCRKYYLKNIKKEHIRGKKYRTNHPEIRQIWSNKNRIKINENRRNIRKNNINFRIAGNLRTRIRIVLKGKSKCSTTIKLVGCSAEFLKKYLESKFKKGMSWSNYDRGRSKWHIDHIRPCASFDLSKKKEQCKCFNYHNLQPLWAIENISKGDKYVFPRI